MFNTRDIHIAVGAASRLVAGQVANREKTNEAATIPMLVEMLDMERSTVTVYAAGATGDIMDMPYLFVKSSVAL